MKNENNKLVFLTHTMQALKRVAEREVLSDLEFSQLDARTVLNNYTVRWRLVAN